MSLFKEEMTASDGELALMSEYSDYTIRSKFPNVIDGLKPVHRRILLTLKNHYKDANPKEATVAGRVMEMHPHGDASISAAIAGLAKPYANIMPLVYSNSNMGTYDGESPAAARYVEVSHAEESEDLFFRGTNQDTLRMVPCESESAMEPANFVPVIPTALIFPVLGIGCGFRTNTSAISVANVCKAARKFVDLKYVTHPNDYKKHLSSLAPYLIPDFPSFCILRNSRQIVSEYRKGNFDCPFVLDGVMKVLKDRIIISTLPPTVAFGPVMYEAGKATQTDKNSWFHNHFMEMKDLAGKGAGVEIGKYACYLRRGENPFDVITMLKKNISFTASWTPTRLYHDIDDGMTAETPLTLLDKWSERRYQTVLGGLKQKLHDLYTEYRKTLALLIIADHAMEVAKIFNDAKDEDATVPILVKKFGLTPFQAKYLQSLPMKKLTSKGKRELQEQIEQIKKDNKELQKKFTRVYQEILDGIDFIDNKYSKKYPAKCTIPSYIGTACYKKTGWIMLENLAEVDQILQEFGSSDIELSLAPGAGSFTVVGCDDPMVGNKNLDLPKYLHASYVGALETPMQYVGVFNSNHTGGAFVASPKISGLIDADVTPVGKRCTIVTKDGRRLVEIDKNMTRATLKFDSPAIKDLLYVSPVADEEVLVVHGNPKAPGQINVDRITGDGKISRVPIGKTVVLGVFKLGQPCMFSIPDDIAYRTPVRHMYFRDLGSLVEPNSTLKLYLGKKKDSMERSIVPKSHKSQLFTIEQ